jgi:hypothetical protein
LLYHELLNSSLIALCSSVPQRSSCLWQSYLPLCAPLSAHTSSLEASHDTTPSSLWSNEVERPENAAYSPAFPVLQACYQLLKKAYSLLNHFSLRSTALANSVVVEPPPWSHVRFVPSRYISEIACSSRRASASISKWSSIISTESIIAVGLVMFFPAYFGR